MLNSVNPLRDFLNGLSGLLTLGLLCPITEGCHHGDAPCAIFKQALFFHNTVDALTAETFDWTRINLDLSLPPSSCCRVQYKSV